MISSLMVGSVGSDENRSVELSRIIGQVSLLVLLKPLQSLNVESLPEQGKRKFPEFCLTELAWLLGAGELSGTPSSWGWGSTRAYVSVEPLNRII